MSEAVCALLLPSSTNPRSRRLTLPPSRQSDLPDPFEGLVTTQQAANLFDVTDRTIRNWRRAGLIEPAVILRGRVFYALDDLMRVVEGGKPSRQECK
jgi:hypothetical protein